MVVPLGPGKFYGSSLPRPRYYSDIRFNSERVDPPVPVLDSFLSWANEAHWSMGGLSFKRLRLQGRIEGNVQRLKTQREKANSHKEPTVKPNNRDASPSPPPAPMAAKRRRFFNLNDDEEEEQSKNEGVETVEKRETKRASKKGAARKLGDDFERVAEDKDSGGVSRGKRSFSDVESDKETMKKKTKAKRISKGSTKGKDEVQSGTRTRSSPRLANRG